MVHRNQKRGRVGGKVASVHHRLAEVTSETSEDQLNTYVREELGACMRAYDGRYVINGGVDRAHKQCKDRLFNE